MPLDEIKFELLLADKRHREVKNTLSLIANILSQKNDEAIISALQKNGDAIKGFVEAVTNFMRSDLKDEGLEKTCKDILKRQEDILGELRRLKEWRFEFDRMGGYIQSPITAKQIK